MVAKLNLSIFLLLIVKYSIDIRDFTYCRNLDFKIAKLSNITRIQYYKYEIS